MVPDLGNAQEKAQTIGQAIQLLLNQNESTHQLWSRLAVACKNVDFVSSAKCGHKAMEVFLKDKSVNNTLSKDDMSNTSRRNWYWIASAEVSLGVVSVVLMCNFRMGVTFLAATWETHVC